MGLSTETLYLPSCISRALRRLRLETGGTGNCFPLPSLNAQAPGSRGTDLTPEGGARQNPLCVQSMPTEAQMGRSYSSLLGTKRINLSVVVGAAYRVSDTQL